MKRLRRNPWFGRVLVAMVFGIIVTVVMAWTAMRFPNGNAWYGPLTDEDLGLVWDEPRQRYIQLSRGRNAWHTVVSYWWVQISGMSMWMPIENYEARKFDLQTLPRRFRPDNFDDFVMQSWYHEVGWPLPALTCSVHWEKQISNADIIYNVTGGVQLQRDADFNPRALPLTPVWWGFIIDVMLYGGIWMLAARGVRTIKRRRRAKRGLCPGCGYSQQGLPAGSRCPECGKAPPPVT